MGSPGQGLLSWSSKELFADFGGRSRTPLLVSPLLRVRGNSSPVPSSPWASDPRAAGSSPNGAGAPAWVGPDPETETSVHWDCVRVSVCVWWAYPPAPRLGPKRKMKSGKCVTSLSISLDFPHFLQGAPLLTTPEGARGGLWDPPHPPPPLCPPTPRTAAPRLLDRMARVSPGPGTQTPLLGGAAGAPAVPLGGPSEPHSSGSQGRRCSLGREKFWQFKYQNPRRLCCSGKQEMNIWGTKTHSTFGEHWV